MKNTRFLKEDAGKNCPWSPTKQRPGPIVCAQEIAYFKNLPDTLRVARCCECQGRSCFFHGFRSYSLANCIAYFPEKAAMKYMTNAQLQEFYIDIHEQCT